VVVVAADKLLPLARSVNSFMMLEFANQVFSQPRAEWTIERWIGVECGGCHVNSRVV
jgi:hypothetical protein